ncbi:hypothetical protein Tco_0400349 [Tanacetum coccineum]
MSLHGFTDDEFENSVHSDTDNVTLISKLDVRHPLRLHLNDSSTLTVVYQHAMKDSLNLTCIQVKEIIKEVEGYFKTYSSAEMDISIKTGFIDNTSIRSNNNEVLETFDRVHEFVAFNLHHKINSLSQNGAPIADYFNKLSTLWKQFDALVQLPREPLPDAAGAYVIISSKGSHRAVVNGLGAEPFRGLNLSHLQTGPRRNHVSGGVMS